MAALDRSPRRGSAGHREGAAAVEFAPVATPFFLLLFSIFQLGLVFITDADAKRATSGIDYVILRPGTLKDDDGDGKVMAGRAITYGDVARGNVAATLAELIGVPEITNEIIELTNGETPVSDAVARLKRG